jgi:outer membrane protein TolC
MMVSSLDKWKLFCSFFFIFISSHCFSRQNHHLKLDDVLRSVSRCYPQIKIAHLEINKTHGEYITALGKFDPSLGFNSASQPVGGYINNYGDTELNIPTFYNGVKLFGGYRNGQGNWPIYYQNYLTNSDGEYRAGLSLPLLRDRLIDKERAGLLTNAEKVRMKQQDAAVTKINVYQEAIKVYWQWVQAGLQVKTFKQLRNLAEKRQKAIVKQATQGALPKLAIAENLQQIVQREQLLNQGKMIFEQARINLSLYYRDENGNPEAPLASELPSDVSEQSAHPAEGLLQLKQHPALKKLQNYSNIIKLKQNLAKNELLPNLNATAYTFKQNGTGGYPLLIPQAAMVGVSFKFPLLQREAKGKLISARNELQQIKTEKTFLFDRLKNQLANLYIGIKMYHYQVDLLNKELNLAKKVQNGETKKFYEGDSTLFLVNQREQTTAQVQLNSINAKVKLAEMIDMARFFSSTESQKLR